jgi:hypothetical protein
MQGHSCEEQATLSQTRNENNRSCRQAVLADNTAWVTTANSMYLLRCCQRLLPERLLLRLQLLLQLLHLQLRLTQLLQCVRQLPLNILLLAAAGIR